MDSTLKRFISFIVIAAFSLSSALGAFASETTQDKGAKLSAKEQVVKTTVKKATSSDKGMKASSTPSSKKAEASKAVNSIEGIEQMDSGAVLKAALKRMF